MKRHEQDQLLKEILAGDDLSDFRQTSLELGLAAVRRRRRQHRAFRASGAALLPLLLAYAIFFWRPLRKSPPTTANSSPSQGSAPALGNAKSEVKLITDDE